MQELYKEIRKAIEKYYDNKLCRSSFNIQDAWNLIDEFIDEVEELVSTQDKKLDDYLQELEDAREEEYQRLREKGIFIRYE